MCKAAAPLIFRSETAKSPLKRTIFALLAAGLSKSFDFGKLCELAP
jgi:hypothetical protein